MNIRKRARRRSIRETLRKYQGNRCCWCGGPMIPVTGKTDRRWNVETLEHLKPLSMGGKDEIANMALAHYRCNQERGLKPLQPKFKLEHHKCD